MDKKMCSRSIILRPISPLVPMIKKNLPRECMNWHTGFLPTATERLSRARRSDVLCGKTERKASGNRRGNGKQRLVAPCPKNALSPLFLRNQPHQHTKARSTKGGTGTCDLIFTTSFCPHQQLFKRHSSTVTIARHCALIRMLLE